jgi:hypothetical protein
LQGQALFGAFKANQPRDYIHAAADRFDGFTDVIRAVRNNRYKYIRNYRPTQGYYLPVEYREQIPTTQELLRLRDAGGLDEYQAQWFRERKDPEELFDCQNDPHELHNLANDPEFAEKLQELSTEMDRWLAAIGDQPNLPEGELIAQLWQGSDRLPETATPVLEVANGQVSITCATKGASIGYKIVSGNQEPSAWSVYKGKFEVPAASLVKTQAHRIGFKASESINFQVK